MAESGGASWFSLPKETLLAVLKKSGCRGMTAEILERHVEDGFRPNEDGTYDIFDYAAWLVGEKLADPPPRTPPTEAFDISSVNPTELGGWLTLYNHLGMEVSRGRMVKMFQSYHFRFRAKDNDRNIDFLKFVAFAVTHRPATKARGSSANRYVEHKAEMNRRNKEASALGRDIGPIPEVVNPDRKEECRYDLKRFCEEYLPGSFRLAWCDDHLRCIAKIEQSILEGGLFALALPRGSGKTSLCEAAAIWAMLYGHRRFVVVVGASESAALDMQDSIKTEFETNDALAADFPEACFPIAQLEGITNRCMGQTCLGERTRITWSSSAMDGLVLPTIKDAASSGIILRVAGITGRIRGMKYKRPDGEIVRPELVIIDDPQTRESARSLEQNKLRLKILMGDILGLAGPGRKITAVMPCTVIEPGDMVDEVLDRDKHPEWNGEKTKLLYSFPENMALWDEYEEIRADQLREDGTFARATEFYATRREEMDRGAVVAWPERFDPGELSAVQYAMDLMYRNRPAFLAEYQNEPLRDSLTEDAILSADEIASKLNGMEQYMVPLGCVRLTMFVDVQKKGLFYAVCAWGDDFTGAVVDYGTFPGQRSQRFTLNSMKPTLQEMFSRASIEGQLYSGLSALFKEQFEKIYVREDGLEMRLDRAAVDANWGVSTEVVYQFCRQTEYSGLVYPAHGHYVGASSKPMSEYRRKAGEKVGLNWYVPSVAGRRAIRHVVFDTNFWKSFVHSRLGVPMGDRGCLSLWGRQPVRHELFSEHLTAEYRVRTQGRGRAVDEWKLRPDRTDNHWLDCLAGCAMLASMLGSVLPQQMPRQESMRIRLSDMTKDSPSAFSPPQFKAEEPSSPPQRKRIRLSELQKNM